MSGTKPPSIGLVCMVRNEQRLIGEFVAHHAGLGIDRIHILDNGSTDATRAILTQAQAGLAGLTVEDWDGDHTGAMMRGAERLRGEVDWLLAIDCDEFLVASTGQSLPDFLARMADFSAIGLNWVIFGSSDMIEDPGDLFTAAFLRRGPDQIQPNRHIKSLVRPEKVASAVNSHCFAFTDPAIAYVNCRRETLRWDLDRHGFAVNAPMLAPFRINHYFCRYRAYWEAKMARAAQASVRIGNSVRTERDWQHHDRNEVEDRSALRHTLKTRWILQRLGLAAGTPGLAPVAPSPAPSPPAPSPAPDAAVIVAAMAATVPEPATPPVSPPPEAAPAARKRSRTQPTTPAPPQNWIEARAAELLQAADRAAGDEAAWLRHHAGCYAAWAAELASVPSRA